MRWPELWDSHKEAMEMAGLSWGLESLVELELAVRVFASNKFEKEGLGHPAVTRWSGLI